MSTRGSGRRSLHTGLRVGIVSAAIGLAPAAQASERPLALPEVVQQAIASNLDFIAQNQALAANYAEIGLARSELLPQIEVGARGQILDDERSDSVRGNNEEESLLLAAGLSQILYDEDTWAGLATQKHVYRGQVKELEAFRLAVIEDAATSFLELDRRQRVLAIQERNRELTRENLETSRARIAAGWSGEREVLRWEVQLAGNDADVREARVQRLQSRFELNRLRNRPPETGVEPLAPSLEEYGFMYARPAVVEALTDPKKDRRMRDFLVRVGLRRSPDLAALDASIAAAERQLVAKRRAFWIPTLSLGAGIDYLTTSSSSSNDFNEREWLVKGIVTFPLFQGGAKFSGVAQARDTLDSLRTQRRSSAQFVEESVRAAMAQASGSYETVGFARRQLEAARRNFELVEASYTLGVASILDLLDAQGQLLEAEIEFANATVGFLEDLVAAERAFSFYAFLESPDEVAELLVQLERELGIQP